MGLKKYVQRKRTFPFYLKRPNSDQPTGIFLKTSFGGIAFKYGTGKSIYPELWDQDTNRTTTNKSTIKKYEKLVPHLKIDLQNIDTRIENIERAIKSYLSSKEQRQEILDLNDLRSHLNEVVKKVVKPSQKVATPFLREFIDQSIKGMEKGTITISSGSRKGQRYSLGTIKNYRGFQEQWKLFEKDQGKKFRFDDISIDVYNNLISFFNGKRLGTNTIGRHIRNLKVIMQLAYDKGIHANQVYRNRAFSAPEIETDHVYLTKKELAILANAKYPDKPHYQLALDVFLVGCYTGLRYSDYYRIRPEYIKTINDGTTKVIEMKTRKTGNIVVIPIKPELETILGKYKYKLPKTYEQKVNRYIKEIARELEITEKVEIQKIKGGIKTIQMVPKCDLIKTHTARRTSVTLMYLAGIDTEYIMKITGHKTEKSFRKYLKISKEEAANKIAKMDYFNGSQLKVS